jgi:serine/threonine protein kinase
VAIKILAPERLNEGGFAGRFTHEAELLARLNHPHIVTIHDFGQTGGLFFLVMEFIDGVNLRDLLREGKLEPKQALAIIPPICDALQYAHDKGIVHRDIKPENILIDRDGRVKIADFGVAKLIGPSAVVHGVPTTRENASRRQHAAVTAVAGTAGYSAPEQTANPQQVDQRADIYSLGAVLYEMLTGERPGRNAVAPSSRVQIDVRLDEIVMRALAKKPERRYQTAAEFRTVLQEAISPPSPVPAAPSRRKRRRKKFTFRFLDPVPDRNVMLQLALTMMLAGIALLALLSDAMTSARARIQQWFDPDHSPSGEITPTLAKMSVLLLILALAWGGVRWLRHRAGQHEKSRSGPAWIIFGWVAVFLAFSDSWNPGTWALLIVAALLLVAVEAGQRQPGASKGGVR